QDTHPIEIDVLAVCPRRIDHDFVNPRRQSGDGICERTRAAARPCVQINDVSKIRAVKDDVRRSTLDFNRRTDENPQITCLWAAAGVDDEAGTIDKEANGWHEGVVSRRWRWHRERDPLERPTLSRRAAE